MFDCWKLVSDSIHKAGTIRLDDDCQQRFEPALRRSRTACEYFELGTWSPCRSDLAILVHCLPCSIMARETREIRLFHVAGCYKVIKQEDGSSFFFGARCRCTQASGTKIEGRVSKESPARTAAGATVGLDLRRWLARIAVGWNPDWTVVGTIH